MRVADPGVRTAATTSLLVALVLLVLPGVALGSSTGPTTGPDPVGGIPALPREAGGGVGPALPGATGQDMAWSPAASSTSLGEGAGLAWSPGSSHTVLFGGLAPSLTNATLLYDERNDTWTNLGAAGAPAPRAHAAFAADPAHARDILFGGLTNATSLATDNQTWTFTPANRTWRMLSASGAPPAREDAAFAVAPYVGMGLLFGGWNQSYQGSGTLIYGDTWTLDLATLSWGQVALGPGTRPPNLHGAGLLWDPGVHRFELFGGCDPCGNGLWWYDPWNTTWTQVPTASPPPGRGLAVWAFDPAQGVDLLFGGENAAGPLVDAYTFNATALQWTLQTFAPGPTAREAVAATWVGVSTNQTLLVAGGNDGSGPLHELWRFAPTCEVPVQVVDARTGAPVAGASVVIDGTYSALTDVRGFGNVSHVPAGSTVVHAARSGYRPANVSLWLDPGRSPPLVVAALPPSPMGNLSVHVVDPAGAPLAGVSANVTIQGTLVQNPPLRTGANGWAVYVGVLASVPATVTAWLHGYHASTAYVTVAPNGNTTTNLTLLPLPRLLLRTWGWDEPVPGTAYPLAGATVWLNGSLYGPSGPGGWLNVSFNRTGPLAVRATAPNFGDGFANISLPFTGTVRANATLLALMPSGLNVNATEASTGTPLPGVAVNDSYSNGLQMLRTYTDAGGKSYTSVLRAGPNVVDLWTAGSYAQADTLFLAPGQVVWIDAAMVTLPRLNLQAHGYPLSGPGAPLAGVTVDWNGGFSGVTGPGGWLNYTPARAGPVQLHGTLPGYRPGWLNLTIPATGVVWGNLSLRHLPSANLSVQVLDRDTGGPLVGAVVNVTLPGGASSRPTLGHGYANFTDVPGPGYAEAHASGFYPQGASVTLVANGTVPLRIDLVPYPIVHLRVLGTNFTAPTPYPLAGASVTFNGTLAGSTDLEGYLNLTTFPGGARWAVASSPLYFSETLLLQLPFTGEVNATFILRERALTTLHVRLRDFATGLGVPFAFVNLTNVDPVPTTYGGTVLSGLSGWGNFSGLGLGNYTLTGFHTGYRVAQYIPAPLGIGWGQGTGSSRWANLTLVNNPYVPVYAWVTNQVDHRPVARAEVLIGQAYASFTDSHGNATFGSPAPPFVPGGTYGVTAVASGYYAWQSVTPVVFPSGIHVNLTIDLKPAPPQKNCTDPSLCPPNPNGTATTGPFSLLPFASGPWWPFFLVPPIFLAGALVYFALTRPRGRGRSGAPPPGVVLVMPPPAAQPPPAPGGGAA